MVALQDHLYDHFAGDKDAAAPEHEFVPEEFNGWPLFGRGNAGHVPMAGPDDDTPIEVGIDLTSLIKNLGPDKDGKGRLFSPTQPSRRERCLRQVARMRRAHL